MIRPRGVTPMPSYSRSHLADDALLRGFARPADDERGSLAEVLADIVEVEKRKLYMPAGYPSMLAYCTDERRFTRDAARRRVNATPVTAKFPARSEEHTSELQSLRHLVC